MFSQSINSPLSPLTVNYLNLYERPRYEYGYSLSCLALALFKPRFPEYEGLTGITSMHQSVSERTLQDVALHELEARKGFTQEDLIKHPCFLYYISCDLDELNTRRTKFAEAGLKELTQVEAYIKQELSMSTYAAYISEELNTAIVVVPSSSIPLYHGSLAFLYSFFPRMFKDKPIQRNEIELLKTLTTRSPGRFISQFAEIMEPMRETILRTELAQCFRGFRQGKIDHANNEVTGLRNTIQRIMADYQNAMDQLNEAIVRYEGLKALNGGDNEQEREAIEYLSTCPRLHNIQYTSGTLVFDVDTILTNYDELKFRNAVRTKDAYNGYRLPDDSPFASLTARKLFMNALFDSNDPDLSIKMRGQIKLNTARSYMDVPRGEPYGSDVGDELDNCVTNPHFERHGCPGQNRNQIMQCLQAGDLVSAIEASIAAVGSVNIAETDLTFMPFMQKVMTSTKKIIRRRDGVDLTPAEALLWLTKKEEKAA